MSNKWLQMNWKCLEFVHTDKTMVYHISRQHKSKSKFFSLKVAIFTPLLKTINHCTALYCTVLHCCHSNCCGGLLLKCAVVQVIAGVTRWKVIDVLVKHLWFAVYHIFCTYIYVTGYLENQTLCLLSWLNAWKEFSLKYVPTYFIHMTLNVNGSFDAKKAEHSPNLFIEFIFFKIFFFSFVFCTKNVPINNVKR